MKKWYKKVIATTLLCFLFVFTNSFALPKWLESLLEKHPALVAVVNRIKQESPNKKLNLGNDLDAAYALYLIVHQNQVPNKPINKKDIIDYYEGGIKLINPGKSDSCGRELFSWLEVPNRIIYSNISVTIDDDSTPSNSPDLG